MPAIRQSRVQFTERSTNLNKLFIVTGDVRRRVVRTRYGRRGRSGDPEYGIKGLLVQNLEHRSPAPFAKITDTLDRDRYGQEIAAARIGREKLRDPLNLRARITRSTPCERDVRGRLFLFYAEVAASSMRDLVREQWLWCADTPGV